MKKLQSLCQRSAECPQCIVCCCRVFLCLPQSYLCHLDIPVTELIPQEIIDLLYGNSKLIFIHILSNITDHGVQSGKDPFILVAQCVQVFRRCYCLALQVHHNETGSIPDLICKVTAGFYTLPVETHIISRCITCHQCQTKGICAVFVDNLQRIDTVSKRLTHLTSL